ncbi:hypothetical protein Bca52824_088129 [Brassica carinata]|uniref:Uncharacterized protein n=2 Tax=Brassica TaxID=3705 RepID=A0ABQ7BIU7_BRACR|nr:hypothetical protein DY000_02038388 [Brassica cretica]KAG2248501.1 hypothetical protein Bca52824_088129 [Brassica carinata]
MFVSFGQDLYAVAEDCGADRIKKEASRDKSKKGIAGERRLVLWYLMMYGHEDAMHKRLKKLLRDGVDDIEKATAASSSSGMDEQMANTNVALAATLADARSMQVAEVIGAKREH